jgi:hypothetical protein
LKTPDRAHIVALLLAVALPCAAAQDIGAVLRHQKISMTEGGFVGPLHEADLFGIGASALGDLDGDGVTELAVGAYFDDDGGPDRGAVWILFLNTDGTVKAQQKISSTQGNFAGPLHDSDLFGWSVAGLGDLDGDGTRDMAVGAWLDDDGGPEQDMGAVYMLFLKPDGTVDHQQKISPVQGGFTGALDFGDRFGTSLAVLGDLDGDGTTEMGIGSLYDDDGGPNCGSAWICFLRPDGTVKAQQKISNLEGGLVGPLPDECRFGYSGTPLGDANLDGVPDVAFGATLDGDGGPWRGAVWLLALDTDGTVKAERKISSTQGGLVGPLDDYDAFGRSIANLGDLDGDGRTDIAVGASGDDDAKDLPLGEDRGALYVLRLSDDGTVKAEQKISDTAGDFHGQLHDIDGFGQALAALGDLDGDGVVDLMASAIQDDDGVPDCGAVWVLFLSDGTWNNPGAGVGGAAGVPLLIGAGPLEPGTALKITATSLPPTQAAWLFVSTAALVQPFKGSVMVPDPGAPGLLLPYVTGRTGDFLLQGQWPHGVPSGTTLWMQTWSIDPSARKGMAGSNALVATSP